MTMFAIIISVAIGMSLLAAFFDARQWNGGICAEYGEPWQHFDTDSQGGRGYKCRDRTIWVSWPVDHRPALS